MTLGRRGRGPDERVAAGPLTSSAVEVEELPPQRVLSRGRRRIRIADVLVAGAIALLLAGGVGALGGRDEPRPTDLLAVDPTPTGDPDATDPPRPLVTPNFACVPLAEGEVPEPILFVNGHSFPGKVNILEWRWSAPAPTGTGREPEATATRIEIRSDVEAFVETGGDACAVAWQVGLSDPGRGAVLDAVDNPARDPDVASQNRFRVPFWTYRGHDYILGAELIFPNLDIYARWPVRILDFDQPSPMLLDRRRSLPLETGCLAELQLNSGAREKVRPCDRSVMGLPTPAVVAPATVLEFSFSDSWDVEVFDVACGDIDGFVFAAREGPCDVIASQKAPRSLELQAPASPGTWTVEIQACAHQTLVDAQNDLCGPWYATIRVRE